MASGRGEGAGSVVQMINTDYVEVRHQLMIVEFQVSGRVHFQAWNQVWEHVRDKLRWQVEWKVKWRLRNKIF